MGLRRALVYAMTSAAIVSAVVLWQTRTSAINDANIAKIRDGMTLQEVEEILGGPARDEISAAESVLWPPSTLLVCCTNRAEWIGPDVAICVGFTNDRVVFRMF